MKSDREHGELTTVENATGVYIHERVASGAVRVGCKRDGTKSASCGRDGDGSVLKDLYVVTEFDCHVVQQDVSL